jgi:hypothetical protein
MSYHKLNGLLKKAEVDFALCMDVLSDLLN